MRALLSALLALGLLGCAPEAPRAPEAAPTSPPKSAIDETPPKLRLPAIARPLRIDLDLTLDPSAPKFSGVIATDLDVLGPTNILWLNANDLTIASAEITANGATQKARVLGGAADFVGFAFQAPIPAGKARLTISYAGVVDREKARGIYSVPEPGGESHIYTFFEPLDARRAFPCFDEPSYKSQWKLTLHVKKGDVARANSAIASEKDEGNGMKAVAFEESRPLPSYLVAFVVGPFEVIPGPDAGHYGTKLNFIVPKGHRDETRYAAEVTPKIIGYLEDYFGMQYPWGKLDVAVVPRFWGTMEHPGIVALGQPLTLIRAGEETISRKQDYADIATHELSHYWFGDYVTMKWWDETWLNESMAQWMDAKITDLVDPSWKFGRVRLDRAESAMQADGLTSAKRIREPVVSNDDIANAFDGDLTYNKGHTVLGMFEQWMGPPKFQRAIRGYITKHAWGNATEEDLFAALDAEGGPAISASMRTFVDQPGVPLIEAKPACDGPDKGIEITQRRYAPAGVTLPDQRWTVPVCVRYGDGRSEAGRACTMLSTTSARMKIESKTCPTWVMSNAGAAGYYRSKYSKASIDAIFRARKSLDDAELASVMSDAAALVGSGDLSLADALSLLPNVADAKDRYLFSSAFSILGIAGSIATDAQRTRFEHYLRTTFGKRARALGWKKKSGESKDDEVLRPQLLATVAIGGRDPDLYKEARALAFKWLADRGALDGDLVEVALGAGAKTNDPALFDAMLAEAKKTQDQKEKERLFSALGSFTEQAFVKRAQALMLDHAINLHDTQGILLPQLEDRRTREAAYSFFDQSFDDLRGRLREDEAMWLFYTPRYYFCDDAHLRAVEAAFKARATKIPGAPRTLDGSLEVIRLCVAKAQAHGASLDAFLQRY